MFLCSLILSISCLLVHGRHFNGGSIRWAPIDPYANSSSVDITITQSYAWAYPIITCANDVPITTNGRSGENRNLICVADCSTDGNYSTQPIDILTDCTSVSSSLGMMNSERSHNMTLSADAHFYLSHVASAWVALNYPTQSGLQWSIVTFIDLRRRPDGFINTPPVTSVVSPQYAFVNETKRINIPVSDVNVGDDVRCRWATYTAGSGRRRRSNTEELIDHQSAVHSYKKIAENKEISHIRNKRACSSGCDEDTKCSDSKCWGTSCSGKKCGSNCCKYVSTTTPAPSNVTTTIDTPGTIISTISYPIRQAIDECGGICFPGSVPNGTTLSNCTISFTGLRANTWYAVAVQVEDFINTTSTTPMSSVPVQFLIYVLPQPVCPNPPIILPVTSCLEVQVGVPMTFDLYVMNRCSSSVATVTDLIVSEEILSMGYTSLTDSPTNTSLSYVTFTWTPAANQVGLQQMCTVAFTSEKLQSNETCITFTVKNSSDVCVTTTTTSTSTTSVTTTTTSVTTTTSSTSTTTSTTSTTTTSVTTTTTSTSATTSTTSTTTTTTTVTTATTTKAPKKPINWLLILGLSLLALLLALCCCCCCLYWFLWGPAARRRRRRQENDDTTRQLSRSQNTFDMRHKNRLAEQIFGKNTPSRDYLVETPRHLNNDMRDHSLLDSRLGLDDQPPSKSAMNTEEKGVKVKRIPRNKMEFENIQSSDRSDMNQTMPNILNSSITIAPLNKVPASYETSKNQNDDNANIRQPEISSASSMKPSKIGRISVTKVRRNSSPVKARPKAFSDGNMNNTTLGNSSVGMQSMGERPTMASLSAKSKTNTSNGVVVKHVSRKATALQTNHS